MTDNATPVNEKDENKSSSPKKEKESSTIADLISTIVGGAAGAFVGGVSNPFSGSSSSAESISSGGSSISSALNSTPSGGDSGTTGESQFGGDDAAEKSTIEVLSKIYKVLSETNSTTNQIHKDVTTLSKNQTQQDMSSDLSAINARARQNERVGTSSPVYTANGKKAEKDDKEDSSILGSIADWFTGGKNKIPKTGPSAADKIKKKGILDSAKDAFSGWGKKEAEKGTAKKIEKSGEKGILDKLKDAFTGPKAKKIAQGAVVGGAALSLTGDIPKFKGKELTPKQKENYKKILEESQKQGLSQEEADAALALAYHESGFNENIKGSVIKKGMHKGDRAHGLFQYMEKSSKGWDRTDAQQNIAHGVEDLKKNAQKYGLKGAYGAHFAGPGAINPNGTPKTNTSDANQTITQYQASVDKIAKDLKRQREQKLKANSELENTLPPLSQNTETSDANKQPELNEKNGKKIKLTGDTSRNPYFGKENTPYEETGTETASPFIPASYNPNAEPPTTFGGTQFASNQTKQQEPVPTPNAADNSKYDYSTDSTGKKLKENLQTGEETAVDNESGKLDPPKFIIIDKELPGGKIAKVKLDLETRKKTTATDDDIAQDKNNKELKAQWEEKQQSSSAATTKTDTGDGLRYDIVTPGEDSKVTTNKASSSKSPKGTFNQSETTTVTTTGGGSTLHVQEQSEEEKAKLAKEEAHEKELEKKYEGVYKTDSYKDQGNPTASPLSKKERDMLNEADSLDAQSNKLKAERDAEPSYKDYDDDKESADKDLNRLSENYAKQQAIDEKRNAIIGTQEYQEARKKQKSQGQSTPRQREAAAPPKSKGGGGNHAPRGNDDPTLKLMEEGTNINHNGELTA
jgi:hypothetical protein